MYDATKSYLPFATVISLVMFVAWSTSVVTREKIQYDHKFVETARITRDLAKATAELAEAIAKGQELTWYASDMSAWCAQQKAHYPQLTCPDWVQPYAKINDSRRIEKTAKELKDLRDAEALDRLQGESNDTKPK